MTAPVDALSDEELLSRYLRDECKEDEEGEVFLTILHRYRDRVRHEMEAAGLPPDEAERRVGTVFVRALDPPDDPPSNTNLRDWLAGIARQVAADPDWVPL